MPENDLKYLGSCFRKSRVDLGLTQEQLSVESGVSLRHIADIEKGLKNPSYEIMKILVFRLGVSPDTLFNSDISEDKAELNEFMGKYHACSKADREILIRTLNSLADELLRRASISDNQPKDTK